jgi:kynurenine formamidase
MNMNASRISACIQSTTLHYLPDSIRPCIIRPAARALAVTVLIRTGRWARRQTKGPWNASELAGLYITCAKWLHQHDAAILGSDAAEDVHPSGIEGIAEPIHALVLIAMGMPIFDNLDLEAVSKEAARRNRWDFLVTASPAAVPGATGSVLNPIATF